MAGLQRLRLGVALYCFVLRFTGNPGVGLPVFFLTAQIRLKITTNTIETVYSGGIASYEREKTKNYS
jgi:hypothetical protein